MGYRYHYTMLVKDIDAGDVDNIADILEEESTYNVDLSYNNENKFGLFLLHEVSWDDPSEALKKISEQYPDKVFEMSFEGDSWDDRGSVYAKNGKTVLVQIYKIVIW